MADFCDSSVYSIQTDNMDERIQKYFQKELSVGERLMLLRQIKADGELMKQFIEYKNMNALLVLADQTDRMNANRQGLQRFNNIIKTNKVRKFLLHVSRYAAVVVLFVIATYWFIDNHYRSDNALCEINNTLFIPAGQRIKITLSDSTEVWLNSQTTFTYPAVFSGKERRVSVEGEAFFSVSKNPEKPFIVCSGGVEMRVLGTKFNVRSYAGEEMRTSLLEGLLQVYLTDSQNNGVILKPHEEVTINGNTMKVDSIPNNDYFLWTDGIYSFDNEPLGNILKRMELYYDVKIIVNDPSISTWKYRGKFRQRDGIDEILQIIQRIHKFRIQKDEEKNTIIISKM